MDLVTAPLTRAAASGVPSPVDTADAQRDWVVIIEPNFSGHRWRYVQWIADACVEAGERCVVVTDTGFASHPYSQRVVTAARPNLRIAFVDMHTVAPGLMRDRSVYARFHDLYRHGFAQVSRDLPIRLVVVPYVDYFFYTLGVLGSPFGRTNWIALIMGATFHHSQIGVNTPRRRIVDPIKRVLFARSMHVRGLRLLLTIDPTLPDWFAASGAARRAAPLEYVADPFPDMSAEDPQRARQRLGLDRHARYLLVYGAISERKGIRELVQALARKGDSPTLLIAGEQDDDTHAFLLAHVPQLAHEPMIFNQFVPEDMERDLFSACDAVWLGYKRHYGMSGVLVQAYRFGKPVVATADGLIGWFCRDGRLGVRVDDLSPEAIARALDALARRWNGNDDTVPPEPGPESLLARNTLDQFTRTFQQAVASVQR